MLGGILGNALTMCKPCWDLIGIVMTLSRLHASERLLSKRLLQAVTRTVLASSKFQVAGVQALKPVHTNNYAQRIRIKQQGSRLTSSMAGQRLQMANGPGSFFLGQAELASTGTVLTLLMQEFMDIRRRI